MSRYVARRLLQMVVAFFGTTFIVYFLMFAISGDPIQALAGEKPISPAQRAQLEAQYHLDRPFIVQYGYYIGNFLTGNLGRTLAGRPIADVLRESWPRSFQLGLMAIGIVALLGVTGGILSGLNRGGWFDRLTLGFALVLIGTPIFVIGTVFQTLLGVELGWFRPSYAPELGLTTYILPALALAMGSLAVSMRLTRTAVVENLRADYVRTARAKGLTWRRIVAVHVLRNSLIPVLTFLGTEAGVLIGSAIVTEGIFNIPGVGNLLFRALRIEDGPLVVSVVSFLVLLYLVLSLIVDIAYAALDPRIRYE